MLMIDFITDAYRLAGICSEIETPSAEQGQKAVTRCNDMFASLAEDGIDLGYNPKADTTATIVLPAGHVLGLKSMLAIRLCAEEGFEVRADTAADSQACYERLLRQTMVMQNVPLSLRTVSHGQGSYYGANIETGE